MTFADIPGGVTVFLDANTFVYAILADPVHGAACKALLDRVERQDIEGVTSSLVLSDTAHRVMTLEACDRFGWPPQGIANRLRRHPDEVKQLTFARKSLDEISAVLVREVPVSAGHVSRAVDLSGQFGLLMNDALIVVLMRENGLTHLASLDSDFDRVPGLTRYGTA
jgi:predicted nucleic acid-binding protein